ncbi:MAG: hypothetical protein QXO51_02255 [Halobacteria archaeon]
MAPRGSFNERANFLAAEYWKAKQKTATQAPEKTRLDEIDRLLRRGISGKLQFQLEQEARTLRRAIDERDTAAAHLVGIQRDLLELVSDFAPSLDVRRGSLFPYDVEREPLREDYFRAVTELLLGQPREAIEFQRATISANGITVPDAVDDTSALAALNYATLVLQEAAKKRLGRENEMDNAWKRVQSREYTSQVLEVLAQSERGLTVEEIERKLNAADQEMQSLLREDYAKGIRRALEMLTDDSWDYHLVEARSHRFSLTDFGRWVWRLCKDQSADAGALPPSRFRLFGRR